MPRREKGPELGYSIKISEIFDETKSASVITTLMEFQNDGGNTWFYETFIWNKGISGVDNFIQYLNFNGSKFMRNVVFTLTALMFALSQLRAALWTT